MAIGYIHKNLVKFGCVVSEICEWTEINRDAHNNTLHSPSGKTETRCMSGDGFREEETDGIHVQCNHVPLTGSVDVDDIIFGNMTDHAPHGSTRLK